MCYACKRCNKCGKFTKGNAMYIEPPKPQCLDCGGELDLETGKCTKCGKQVIHPIAKTGFPTHDR